MFEAFDRERRQIEAELHDGVQQDLVATSVTLQLALQLVDTDPPAARALLEELEEQVVGALDRVRALAHEIYPSLLPARGLADALRAAEIDAGPVARYPLELEEAVYFACRALQAGATRLRVWDDSGTVHLEAVGAFDDAAVARARARIVSAGGQLTASVGGASATVPASSSAR